MTRAKKIALSYVVLCVVFLMANAFYKDPKATLVALGVGALAGSFLVAVIVLLLPAKSDRADYP